MKTRLLIVLSLLAFQCSFATTIPAVDPVAPTLQPLTCCDPNNDGFGTFDFADVNYQILAAQSSAASNYVVGYYSTPTDAQTGGNPISSPYNNINPWNQTIYFKVTNISTNAFAVGSLQLIVNPTPDVTVPTDISMCDSNNDGFEVFDFIPLVPQLVGTNNAATITVTFHTSLLNANLGTSPIAPITNYVAANGTVIWARVAVIATGCYKVVSFHLYVTPVPLSMQPNYPEYALCDSTGAVGYEVFDLNSRVPSILMGQTGMYVTFYPSLTDAQSNTNEIMSPSGYINVAPYVQTLGIRITNAIMGCYTISTMNIIVKPLPNPVLPGAPYTVCDTNQDGIATFDLTSIAADLNQGSTNPYTITFYETVTDAEIGGVAITSPYVNISPFVQTVYARAEDQITHCYTIISIQLDVNPAPITPVSLPMIVVCDSDSNPQDGTTAVNLTPQTPAILSQQFLSASNYTVTYYSTMTAAQTGTSPILNSNNYTGSNGQTIWVRVENSTTGCYGITTFTISVAIYPNPIITTITGFNTVYVDASNNVVQSLLLDSGVTGNYSYQWYLNETLIAGATNSTYSVNSATANNESRTYSVGVENASDLGCSAMSLGFVVLQSNGVPPPTGLVLQSFPPGATLANIVVSGTNVQWYASATNKTTTSTPLPLNTLLVDGTTYYASQTVGGIESVARLPVTVHVTLGVNDNEIFPIRYAPNPVKDILTLQSSVVLKSVHVYTMLGQKVLEQNVDGTAITIDLSRLTTGNYIVKVEGETGQKTLRIIKE